MPRLKDIVYKVHLNSVTGDRNKDVSGVSFNSREVKKGDLFVAVRGTQVDGHNFITQALDSGAVAIVCEEMPSEVSDGITYVVVENSAQALGIIASNYYNNPSQSIKLVGVTGTNGKTTTVTLLHQLFLKLGFNAGLISTVENKINQEVIPASHTTPDSLTINKLLSRMKKEGCTHCFMEVSSHAIDQERIAGLNFRGAVFTNISRDHLDYHPDFDSYLNAKKKLFDDLGGDSFALVNGDDKRSQVILQNTKASKHKFSLRSLSDFKAKVLANSLQGLELEIEQQSIWFKLVGDFNAYNLLGAYATALLLDEKPEEVLTGLSEVEPAAGRFEQVTIDSKIIGIIDYAHTPDALKKVLATIRDLKSGNEQVITVVGCGGNRDRGKRPLMAQIACDNSDKVIFTSDNPRDESPEDIIAEMQQGVGAAQSKKAISITDRKEAIKTAVSLATNHDIILVAGKGHENYQEIKGKRHPFDDKQVLIEMLKLMQN